MSFGLENAYQRIVNDLDDQSEYFKQLLIENYNLFLEIRLENKNCSPSDVIDMLWHSHILDTKNYYNYCTNNFGYVIHHDPDDSVNQSERLERVMNTMRIIGKNYEINQEIWNVGRCELCHDPFTIFSNEFMSSSLCSDCDENMSSNQEECENEPKFSILVKQLNGTVNMFDVCGKMYVKELALKMKHSGCVGCTDECRFIYRGKQLEFNKKLEYYNVKDKDVIPFIRILRGC